MADNYTVAFSYNPEDLRYGYASETEALYERIRNRALIQGKLRVIQIRAEYLASYASALNEPTLGHLRDLLVGIGLGQYVRCMQSVDTNYSVLSSHANRYWSGHAITDVWEEVPAYDKDNPYEVEPGFYGLAGSLGFLLYIADETGEGLLPVQLIERSLSLAWNNVGIDYSETTPKQRHRELTTRLGVAGYDNWAVIERIVNRLYLFNSELDGVTIPESLQSAAGLLYGSLALPGTWSFLKQRFLLGEVDDELVPCFDAVQVALNTDVELRAEYNASTYNDTFFSDILAAADSILPPAGTPLFYSAFAAESAAAAVSIIETFARDNPNVDIFSLPLTAVQSIPLYSQLRATLAEALALGYDAYAALAFFGNSLEAAGYSYRFYLIAAYLLEKNHVCVIPTDTDWRLAEFMFDYNDTPVNSDPLNF